MSRMMKYADGLKQELGITSENKNQQNANDMDTDFLEPDMSDFAEPFDAPNGFDGSFEGAFDGYETEDFENSDPFEEPADLEEPTEESETNTEEPEPPFAEVMAEPLEEPLEETEEMKKEEQLPLDIPEPNETEAEEMPFSEVPLVQNTNAETEEQPKEQRKKSGKKKKPSSEITEVPDQPNIPMLLVPSGAEIVGNITSAIAVEVYGNISGDIVSPEAKIHGVVNGDIYSPNIYLDSPNMKGNIYCNEQLRIGENAVVVGNIEAKSVIVAGTVRGDLIVNGLTVVMDTAQITGDIKTKSLQIEAGAIVRGTCNLGCDN